MGSITVHAQGQTYPVLAGENLLDQAGERISCRKAAVITDSNVEKLYAQRLIDSLKKAGIQYSLHVVPAGEQSKSHEQLLKLYEQLFEAKITRTDCIVALGGGVVGDLAGYAAATYLRGVPLVQIPTTLLAQVDSSVGGKVAVNLPQGKNLIGAFYQPELVLADSGVLLSLDGRQLGAGLGEVVKYGCIADRQILALLREQRADSALLSSLVLRCCGIKARYVEEDPLDHGVRMQLNFGHTLGHAIEKTAGYGAYLHGEGVCIGMVAAAKWGEELGVTPQGTAREIQSLLEQLRLPVQAAHLSPEKLEQAMLGDKKGQGDDINIVLLEELGQARTYKLPKAELGALLRRCL